MISYSRQQKALEELAEIDKISEQKKKEQEEQKAIEFFREQTKDIYTTRGQSIEEIKRWCGNKTSTERLHDFIYSHYVLIAFIFTIIVDIIIMLLAAHFDGIEDALINIFVFILFGIAIFILSIIYLLELIESLEHKIPKLIDKVKEKTLDVHYSISENTIDCPIEVKRHY